MSSGSISGLGSFPGRPRRWALVKAWRRRSFRAFPQTSTCPGHPRLYGTSRDSKDSSRFVEAQPRHDQVECVPLVSWKRRCKLQDCSQSPRCIGLLDEVIDETALNLDFAPGNGIQATTFRSVVAPHQVRSDPGYPREQLLPRGQSAHGAERRSRRLRLQCPPPRLLPLVRRRNRTQSAGMK